MCIAHFFNFLKNLYKSDRGGGIWVRLKLMLGKCAAVMCKGTKG